MYLPTLTTEELLHYVGTLELTEFEAELVKRFEEFIEETGDKETELGLLGDRVNAAEERNGELSEELIEANARIAELEEDVHVLELEVDVLRAKIDDDFGSLA